MNKWTEKNQIQRLLITGAGSGIGRALAEVAVQHGCEVLLAGRTEATLIETQHYLQHIHPQAVVYIYKLDVTDSAMCVAAAQDVASSCGIVDAVACVAGDAQFASVANTTPAIIKHLVEANLLGVMYPVQAFWAQLQQSGRVNGASVLGISSMSAVDPFLGLGVYGAAKAGVNLWLQALAAEGENDNIYTTAIAPGAVETAMLRRLVDQDVCPTEMTLTPLAVAQICWKALNRELNKASGETIWLPDQAAVNALS